MSGVTKSGVLDAGAAGQQAMAIAGALAEAGVAQLRIELPNAPARVLRARRTDLPALLDAAPPGTVLIDMASVATRVERTSKGWAWRTDSDSLAAAIRRSTESLKQ